MENNEKPTDVELPEGISAADKVFAPPREGSPIPVRKRKLRSVVSAGKSESLPSSSSELGSNREQLSASAVSNSGRSFPVSGDGSTRRPYDSQSSGFADRKGPFDGRFAIQINNLSANATRNEVGKVFRSYGELVGFSTCSGFAIAEYKEKIDAQQAIDALNGAYVCGGIVKVFWTRARPRDATSYHDVDSVASVNLTFSSDAGDDLHEGRFIISYDDL